ncbi:MAG: hypothetical protein U5R06_08215 [candidate division KSB1 bacterium]|nr:hypothetical protein [candidate division KSB1 bacterium]
MVDERQIDAKLCNIINRLKVFDKKKEIDEKTKDEIKTTLINMGTFAVPSLIELLKSKDTWVSGDIAAYVLGEIGDKRAIIPLADLLEDSQLGDSAYNALLKFGTDCIFDVIKRIENRILHPIDTGSSTGLVSLNALSVIGETRCEESSVFLKRLLDDYMSEMPNEDFDPTKMDWKYRNVDFFHVLDCMVKQQDKSAIPHIKKARDFFPKEYTEYLICQIAIGRLKKGKVEGFLPMEAMEISMPSGRIMDALSDGELGWEDTFEKEYGEYLDED